MTFRAHIKNYGAQTLLLGCLVASLAGIAAAATQDVYLKTAVKVIPPNTFNNISSVTMWGYAKCTDVTFTNCSSARVPGPALKATAGDTLNIHVQNALTGPYTEPVSVIIPGQTPDFTVGTGGWPTWTDNSTGNRTDVTQRVRSFTKEAAVSGTQDYSWTLLKPGTYLYESGTHPAVQVQMGLYGSLSVYSLTPGQAYDLASTAFGSEVTLLYSEIDPELHYSIASGRYGTPQPAPPAAPIRGNMTSTTDYHPQYFLVNGAPWSPTTPPLAAVSAGAVGPKVLLRLLNAGLDNKTPTLQGQGLYMTLIAEDGNPYTYQRQQYSTLLPAGKTMDAIIQPTKAGTIAIYDRRLSLTNGAVSPGGQLSYLTVTGVPAIQLPATLSFGSVRIGTSSNRTLTIQNPGQANLVISAFTITGTNAAMFTTNLTVPRTIVPGGSTSFTVTFAPTSTGAKSATLTLTTNDPLNPTKTVALTGTGTF